MTAPTPNAELAYRVLDHIDAHPEQHDQADFVRHTGDATSIAAEDMPCGTTACFAGWTVLLSGRSLDLRGICPKAELDGRLIEVDDVAARLLGIGKSGMIDSAPHALFYEAETRADLGRLVAKIFGPRPVDWDKPLEPVMGVPASGCDCSIDGGHGLAPWPDRSHPHAEDCPAYRAPDDVPPNAGSSS